MRYPPPTNFNRKGAILSEFEISIPIPNSNYGEVIIIEKYGDTYSLILGRASQNSEGTVWKQWGFPQDKDKNPRPKAIPWKIPLGNYTDAVDVLAKLCRALKPVISTQTPVPATKKDVELGDDIPF